MFFSNFSFSAEFKCLSSKKSFLSFVLLFQALFLSKVPHSLLTERVKSFTFIIASVFPNIIIYKKYGFLLFACIFAWKKIFSLSYWYTQFTSCLGRLWLHLQVPLSFFLSTPLLRVSPRQWSQRNAKGLYSGCPCILPRAFVYLSDQGLECKWRQLNCISPFYTPQRRKKVAIMSN